MSYKSQPSITFWPKSWRYIWPLINWHETENCYFWNFWVWQIKWWKKGKRPSR